MRAGEHWVLMGPNGGGKTSLMNALLGYLSPVNGFMELFGRTYGETDWREARRPVALVSSALVQRVEPGETVLETVVSGKSGMINFWGTMTGRDRRRASALLASVDAEPAFTIAPP